MTKQKVKNYHRQTKDGLEWRPTNVYAGMGISEDLQETSFYGKKYKGL